MDLAFPEELPCTPYDTVVRIQNLLGRKSRIRYCFVMQAEIPRFLELGMRYSCRLLA